MRCRFCETEVRESFIDLGFAPPSNSYLSSEDLNKPEIYYPLHVKVCENCWLVQTEDYAPPEEFFNDKYAYFSSASQSWLSHAENFSNMAIERFSLDKNSFVVEIASNDGYLLKNFIAKQIPCLGVEPTGSTYEVAKKKGIPTLKEFFGEEIGVYISKNYQSADLIIANNVYAHVPDINDFTAGLKLVLNEGGVVCLEFPHILELINNVQFDTIYHEHFSYLSLKIVDQVFRKHGLRIWDVEKISTHGGSLRVFGCHINDDRGPTNKFNEIIELETASGLQHMSSYGGIQAKAEELKNAFVSFLINTKNQGLKVAAYGAAAKGNTLLNFSGVKSDLIPFVCDLSPEKIGKFLPGSHIPILSPEVLGEYKPDFVVIFPWNIADEIKSHLSTKLPSTKFVTFIPEVKIHEQKN